MLIFTFILALLEWSGIWFYVDIVTAGGLAIAILVLLLKRYIHPQTAEERKNFVQLVFQILGGAVVLLGVYFTWQQLLTSQEGQITERYTKAIEQLGKSDQPASPESIGKGGQSSKENPSSKENNLAIRLGGIYALERIARDSAKDHWSIMEVLTAYVRQNAPRTEQTKLTSDLPADIQAILTVIGRRNFAYHDGEDRRLDLSRINLKWAILDEAKLQGATFTSTNLDYASLKRAHMEEAILLDAHLQEAFLEGVYLQKADLRGANLRKAHLTDANFTGADISGADLREAEGLTQRQIDSAFKKENILIDTLKK